MAEAKGAGERQAIDVVAEQVHACIPARCCKMTFSATAIALESGEVRLSGTAERALPFPTNHTLSAIIARSGWTTGDQSREARMETHLLDRGRGS